MEGFWLAIADGSGGDRGRADAGHAPGAGRGAQPDRTEKRARTSVRMRSAGASASLRDITSPSGRHRDGVLRFVQHPIANGVAAGLDSKIMSIKRKAADVRNPSHFTTAIYFHCGGAGSW